MEFRTLNELFLRRVEASGARTAHRVHRGGRWVEVSWNEVAREVEEVANGLLALGLRKGDAVAVIGETRPEWGICDIAILAAGGRTVGIYQTNTAKQCEHILADSASRLVFVENEAQLAKISEARPACPALEKAILWDGAAPGDGGVLSYSTLREMGREHARSHPTALAERRASVAPADEAFLIYTSGTTGMPKGAILTHKNVVTLLKVLDRLAPLTEDDITVSFLPMAHGAERVVGFWNRVSRGFQAAYARSIQTLIDDIREIRPTVFGSVPRIFEKAYARIQTEIRRQPAYKRKLIEWALRVGGEMMELRRRKVKSIPKLLEYQYLLADRLVLQKFRALFGGRVKYFITGAAPISLEILQFFHACGMIVLECYGLTEGTVLSTVNRHDDYKLGTVGKALPGVQIKIAPDGEILVKGDLVFKGYHNLPEATAEILDAREGWLHTGDIGDFDAEGFLRITDRKKNLIITSGGKNIAPANIENALKADPIVGHALAIGDRRPYVVALIALDPDTARQFARENGLPEDLPALSRHARLLERVQRAVDAANRELARYEQVKRFALIPGELSQDAGELTPTLKVKRKVVEEKYKDLIEAMYGDVPAAEAQAG